MKNYKYLCKCKIYYAMIIVAFFAYSESIIWYSSCFTYLIYLGCYESLKNIKIKDERTIGCKLLLHKMFKVIALC